jgi:hypothetical protein
MLTTTLASAVLIGVMDTIEPEYVVPPIDEQAAAANGIAPMAPTTDQDANRRLSFAATHFISPPLSW